MNMPDEKRRILNPIFPLLLFVCILISPYISSAQNNPPTQDDFQKQQEIIEENAERDDNATFDFDNLVDLLTILQKNPVNLNKAGEEELRPLIDLRLLDARQINAILSYRNQLGKFISIYELQAVPFLDVATIKNLLPYVVINADITTSHIKFSDLIAGGDYMLLVRGAQILEEQKGYSHPDSNSTSRYLGSPLNLYTRFRYTYGTKLSYGITGQKDPGEEFFKGTQKQGFDFYSAHIFYRGNGLIKAVALGDYTLNFGQGLMAGSGFGVNKSSYITSIKSGGRTLKSYTSVDEYNFFRGGAVTLGARNVYVTAFGSFNKIDGNIASIDTIDEELFVTNIGGDGYHRTPSELEDKNTNSQTVFGANVDYNIRGLNAGVSMIHSKFDLIIDKGSDPYNLFAFEGDQLSNYGAHFDWQYKNFNWFGEGVISNPGSAGMLSGLIISIDPKVDLSFLYRNYGKDFNSLYSNAFGESSTTKNESGLYSGFIFKPVRKWEIDAYADFFSKQWLAYQVDAPSVGVDYLVQVNYKPGKTLSMYLRWKDESKQTNSSLNDQPLDYVVNTEKQNLRFDISYKATAAITLRSRAEWVIFKEEKTDNKYGFLAYQDIIWRQLGSPLQLTGRFCIFDANDYDARIYAYENDVLYQYYVPAFNNRGIRFYLLSRLSVNRHIDFWVRYAITYYSNLDVISSGLDEIQGNTKSELKAEMRLRF